MPLPPPSTECLDLLVQELLLRQIEEQHGRAEIEAAERREQQYNEHQFIEKANTLVSLWTAFVKEYNEGKTFNVKIAAKLTRAFHELETSKGWAISSRNKISGVVPK